MRRINLLLFVSLFAVFSSVVKAQQKGTKNIINSVFYNGVEYISHSPKITGSAFFPSKDYQTGSVVYDNVVYNDVQLKYDAVKDQLITPYFTETADITLLPGYVSKFSIGSLNFIFLNTDNFSGTKVPSGYFQEVVNDKVSFLIRHRKTIKETSSLRDITSAFLDEDEFYIIKNNTLYKVLSKSSVLSLFKDNKKELNNFLKEQSINFQDNPELAIQRLVQKYNDLMR